MSGTKLERARLEGERRRRKQPRRDGTWRKRNGIRRRNEA